MNRWTGPPSTSPAVKWPKGVRWPESWPVVGRSAGTVDSSSAQPAVRSNPSGTPMAGPVLAVRGSGWPAAPAGPGSLRRAENQRTALLIRPTRKP